VSDTFVLIVGIAIGASTLASVILVDWFQEKSAKPNRDRRGHFAGR
jgi:hypothetical protein